MAVASASPRSAAAAAASACDCASGSAWGAGAARAAAGAGRRCRGTARRCGRNRHRPASRAGRGNRHRTGRGRCGAAARRRARDDLPPELARYLAAARAARCRAAARARNHLRSIGGDRYASLAQQRRARQWIIGDRVRRRCGAPDLRVCGRRQLCGRARQLHRERITRRRGFHARGRSATCRRRRTAGKS